ncbi:MAG TPA: SpoIIE family protein phosphatase [Burkholderiales bacterium]|nr:SpoIIE family protein phosphatase [Burkholderiales bacterium]
MNAPSREQDLSARDLEPILGLASKLAAPFDLETMLAEVVDAGTRVLHADRGSVWLYDRNMDELVLRVANEIKEVRIPAGTGIVGSCARTRQIINVPDCYADSRFDPSTDKRTGYRTRCLLTLPLVDHKGILVGVMQLLNKADGVFDAADESLGRVLAAQCAVALQRTLMMEELIEGEKLRQQLETARIVQMSTLPSSMPYLPGYEVCGVFKPADLTGGDTYDLAMLEQGLLIVLGDATGHGIGPALSVTQMQAMLRMAFRMGADLETAYKHVNNQLAERLPSDRFITAFIGLLDTKEHKLQFHSGGQGPIFVYRAQGKDFAEFKPTSFPLAAMPLERMKPSISLTLGEGDILALVSDGIFEQRNSEGEEYGEARVKGVIERNNRHATADIVAELFAAIAAFAGEKQDDDMTVVFVKRAGPVATRTFKRSFDELEAIFAFTRENMNAELAKTMDFVLEELFTNVVKYGTKASAAPVRIDIVRVEGGAEVTIIDTDAEPFDVTQAPDADINLPLEERRPGGLGIHLIRKMVDTLQYSYVAEERTSRITFRKTEKTNVDD